MDEERGAKDEENIPPAPLKGGNVATEKGDNIPLAPFKGGNAMQK
ncbi:hypothetical protein RCZ04_02110 [Capnocytophaga sp. HP1101]